MYYLCRENKALISCSATAQLICVFVFAYANSRFSHYKAHTVCGGGGGGVIVFMCEGVGDASVCRYANDVHKNAIDCMCSIV